MTKIEDFAAIKDVTQLLGFRDLASVFRAPSGTGGDLVT